MKKQRPAGSRQVHIGIIMIPTGKWYYLNASGVMQTGWIKLNGKWYYLKSSGEMISGEKVTIGGKSYTFNSNGVWIK